jgi:hypothetical protein
LAEKLYTSIIILFREEIARLLEEKKYSAIVITLELKQDKEEIDIINSKILDKKGIELIIN